MLIPRCFIPLLAMPTPALKPRAPCLGGIAFQASQSMAGDATPRLEDLHLRGSSTTKLARTRAHEPSRVAPWRLPSAVRQVFRRRVLDQSRPDATSPSPVALRAPARSPVV
ncbi:hypothetical protein GF325_06090 [Candidatus Bathyarchaeota archaeon]|nr:hypothetical protein [Candidatus Bathyarchaeota archaeon]